MRFIDGLGSLIFQSSASLLLTGRYPKSSSTKRGKGELTSMSPASEPHAVRISTYGGTYHRALHAERFFSSADPVRSIFFTLWCINRVGDWGKSSLGGSLTRANLSMPTIPLAFKTPGKAAMLLRSRLGLPLRAFLYNNEIHSFVSETSLMARSRLIDQGVTCHDRPRAATST